MSIVDFELLLSRNVFGPREVSRAGDLWRLCQDAALLGSSARGWDPARYRREGVAFVLRRMTAVHLKQVAFGDPITGTTWVSSFRRGMFSNRQIRMEVQGQRVTEATQEWVHVSQPELQITRAPASLIADFAVADLEPDVCFPVFLAATGPEFEFG
ncbi:MAG: hypothetical protein GWP91_02220, partial [Rhodobacterales bacterium]|nr:hypothetical protein [Rhodobacterales bacterium]